MPTAEAKAWLTSLDGVGPKTASIVLLFALGKPAFPVDTHIHRVTGRLGLIPLKTSADKAHGILEELVPPEWTHSFHLNVIEHGRQVCKAQRPLCERCVLQKYCDDFVMSLWFCHTHVSGCPAAEALDSRPRGNITTEQ